MIPLGVEEKVGDGYYPGGKWRPNALHLTREQTEIEANRNEARDAGAHTALPHEHEAVAAVDLKVQHV